MRVRRLLGVTLALIALVGSACAGAPEDGRVHITFRYLWTGSEAKAIEQIIASFNRSQDRITVDGVSNPDQQSQLAAMSSGNGSFDISDSFGVNTGTWASRGVLEPLDPYIERDGMDTSEFVSAAMTQSRFEQKTYAFPIAAHSKLLVYNTELLRKAGIRRPPRTMTELATAIRRLTVQRDGQIRRLGFGSPTDVGVDFLTLGWAFGGRWYDQKGQPTPNTKHNREALRFYVDTVAKKYGVRQLDRFTSGFGDYQSPQNPFYQGTLAMTLDTEVISRFAADFAPKLPWSVAPVPHPEGRPDLANTTEVETSTVFIARNSEHKDEAWEFLKYLVSPEPMGDFTYALGNLPTRSALLDDPRYDSLPHFEKFAKALESPNARSLPSAPTLVEYQADLENAFEQAARRTKTPEEALSYVAERVKSYDDFR